MWSYYGRKSKIINLYPKPKHDVIIEPFAGTAVYSLHEDNWKKDVILVDKYEVIVRIWKYLQIASPKDVLNLPNMKKGDKVPEYLCEEEQWLMGFCINRGATQPKKTASNYNSWDRNKLTIAENMHKIKHWDIRLGSYEGLENISATWFIDPPYKMQGKYYKHNGKNIDFIHLGNWCKERKGQVIVCENLDADWLNFHPLVEFRGLLNKNIEAIWYKEYDFNLHEDDFIEFLIKKTGMTKNELKNEFRIAK